MRIIRFCFITIGVLMFSLKMEAGDSFSLYEAAAWWMSEEDSLSCHWWDVSGDSAILKDNDKEYFSDRQIFNFNPALHVSETVNLSSVVEREEFRQMSIFAVVVPDTLLYGKEYPYLSLLSRDTVLLTSNRYVCGSDTVIYAPQRITPLSKEKPIGLFSFLRSSAQSAQSWGNGHSQIVLGRNRLNALKNDTLVPFAGYFPECIMFRRILSPMECRQVESLLALKYGLSLQQSYVDMDGNLLWDIESAGGFSYRVTGIGMSAENAFVQQQSVTSEECEDRSSYSYSSSQSDSRLFQTSSMRLLSIGRDSLSLLKEGNFTIWADDNGSLSTEKSETNQLWQIIGRSWLVQTNFADSLKELKGGNWLEMSYRLAKWTEATGRDSSRAVLLINPQGDGDFDNANLRLVPIDSIDTERGKLIFRNFVFDEDGNGIDQFSFGFYDGVLANFYPRSEHFVRDKRAGDGQILIDMVTGNSNYEYVLLADSVMDIATGDTLSHGYFKERHYLLDSLKAGRYRITLFQHCEDGTQQRGTGLLSSKCFEDSFSRRIEVGLEGTIGNRDSVYGEPYFVRPVVVDNLKDVKNDKSSSKTEIPWVSVTMMGGRNIFIKIDTEVKGRVSVALYNPLGQLIDLVEKNDHTPILLTTSREGIYLLKVMTYDREYTEKLVVR